MALDNFSNLKTAIADFLDRDDLTSQIPDFITLAEARHKREIRIQEMLTRSTLTVDDRYVSLPSDFLEARTLRLLTDPVTVLSELNLEGMNRTREEGTGKPTFFTVHSQIEFNKTPDQSYDGEIIFFKAFTALSDSDPSNSLLTRAPDVYLYGALVASAPFLMNDERIQVWNSMYEAARNALNGSDRRGRNVGPLVSRVIGATP